jgi:hypothetical protein
LRGVVEKALDQPVIDPQLLAQARGHGPASGLQAGIEEEPLSWEIPTRDLPQSPER